MLDGSLAQVLQLPEVDLGEQGQRHGRKGVMKQVVRGIKLISMKSTITFGESHGQVPQLQEVDHGEHGQRHEMHSINEVGHVRYQNNEHEKLLNLTSHKSKFLNFKKLILVSTDTVMRCNVVMKQVMLGIKLVGMGSTTRLGESHAQVP